MSDAAIQALSAVVIAAIGIITTYITVRGRASRDEPDAAPVTNEQVREAEDPGVVAIKIAYGTQLQLEKTQADLDETKSSLGQTQSELKQTVKDLEAVRGELRSVLAELESIARDLRRFVEWEESGAHGSPPIALTDIYARLEALTRKRPHP